MFRPRVIPVLLLKNQALVKSIKFSNYQYIGDPINAVRIFNDLCADELVFLDILATKENRLISLDFVRNVGEEANMPFSVGGGIRSIRDIREIISAGAEKVILCTKATEDPDFVRKAANEFGSSTIVVCIDVKKKILGNQIVWSHAGTKSTKYTPVEFACLMQDCGAGEIIIQSISHDGTMQGYDLSLIRSIAQAVSIPVVALGGAGSVAHLKEAYQQAYANGLAAGSLFVFHGKNKGVLVNYPEKTELQF